MPYELLNPITQDDWNASVLEFRHATVFHTLEWARVLAEAYGYTPRHLRFKEGGRIVAILPAMEVHSRWTGRRGVCLPFSDQCEPLLRDGATLQGILEPLRNFGLKNQWDYLEWRGGESVPFAKQTDEFMTHDLNLETTEDLQVQKLRDSTRRNIRRAVREGVAVEHLRTMEAMNSFYSLHCRTRRRHGLPPQPLQFFH